MIEGCCAAAMAEAGYTITSTPMRRRTLNAFARAVPHAVRLESRIRRIAKRVESRLLNATGVL